jgi:hypothetical protein
MRSYKTSVGGRTRAFFHHLGRPSIADPAVFDQVYADTSRHIGVLYRKARLGIHAIARLVVAYWNISIHVMKKSC